MSVKLAAGLAGAPFLKVYDRVGNVFTAQTLTGSNISSAITTVDWNSDGTSIAIAQGAVSPFAQVYNAAGSTYTRIINPFGTISTCSKLEWNPSGTSIALGQPTAGGIRIFNRSGDTFTQTADTINTYVSSVPLSISWNHDGSKIAVGNNGVYKLAIFSRSDDTFTYEPLNPTPTITLTNGISDISWNHDGTSIAFCRNNAGTFQVVNYTPDASPYLWTAVTGLPVDSVGDKLVAWKPDGSQLAVASDGTASPNAYVKIYSRSGNTFTLATTINQTTAINSIAWNTDGTSIAIGSTTHSVYNQTSSTSFSLAASPTAANARSITWVGTNTPQGQATLTSLTSVSAASQRFRSSPVTASAVSQVTALAKIVDYRNYVEVDYADPDYWLVGMIQNAQASLIVQAFSLNDQARTRRAVAAVTAQVTATAIPLRLSPGSSTISAQATVVSTSKRTRSAQTALTATVSSSAQVLRIRDNSAIVNSIVNVNADCDVIRSGNSTLATTATLSALALRIQDVSSTLTSTNTVVGVGVRTRVSESYFVQTITVVADADRIARTSVVLTALDTVVSGAAYKAGTQAQISVVSSVMANADRLAGGLFDSLYRAPTGIVVDSLHHPCIIQLKYPAGDAYILEFGLPYDPWRNANPAYSEVTGGETIISFWAQFSGSGCIWSSVNVNNLGSQALSFEYISSGFRLESQQAFGGPSNWTSRVDWLSSANDGEWHHYTIKINDFASELNIDGYLITQTSQAYIRQDTLAPTAPQWNSTIAFPINLGAKVSVSYIGGSWVYIPSYTDQLTGAIAQLWIGDVYTSGAGYDSNQFAPLNDYYRLTTDETPAFNSVQGKDGYGITFSRVYFYDELDYPYLQAGPYTVNGNQAEYLTRDRLTGRETSDIVRTTDWIPATTLTSVMPGGARARFTLTGIVTKAKPGLAEITAQATLSATMTGLIQADAAIVATTTVLATSTRLNSYRANLVATATVVSQAQPFRSGVSESTGVAAVTAVAGRIAGGQANLTVNSTVSADGDDQNSGRADLFVVCQVVAQDTNFTKAESRITANFALTAVGTALVPTKGEVLQVSAFNLSVDADVIRGSITQLVADFSTLTRGGRVASGQVSMLAFAVSVTAGRIVNFFDENILIVPQEQNGLIVFVEPRITNPQFENRVNTVLAEPRDIVVAQATGLLLSQFN